MTMIGIGLGLTFPGTPFDPHLGPPPENLTAPVLSGTPAVGQRLSVTNGTWTNSPFEFAYYWRSNGADISGASINDNFYDVGIGQSGKAITCLVRALNYDGIAEALSNQLIIS